MGVGQGFGFTYGGERAGVAVVGDWDANGTFTPGIVRKRPGFAPLWTLSNSTTGAGPRIRFSFGNPSTDRPIVGDWDANGTFTPGIVRERPGFAPLWTLSNSTTGAGPLIPFLFGNPSTDRPIVGDWDANGTFTPGIVRASRQRTTPGTDTGSARPGPLGVDQVVTAETSALLPVGLFLATGAVRAAVALRAARAASALRAASIAVRAEAAFARVATTQKIREVQATAKTVADRGATWLKANWARIGRGPRACLATSAIMHEYNMLRDNKLTSEEWFRYTIFGPRLVSPGETLQIRFPITFDRSLEDEVVSCAVGLGVTHLFGKTQPR